MGAAHERACPTTIVAYRSEIWGVNQRVKGMDMNAYMKWDDIIEKITLEGDQILKFAETSLRASSTRSCPTTYTTPTSATWSLRA